MDTNWLNSQQPWCTYALHIATFTSLAFVMDPLIMYAMWEGLANWNPTVRLYLWWANFVFVFAFTKTVKLWGLFKRNPSDIMFLPLSIVFGYFHGLIKLYALFTLNMVCTGSLLRLIPTYSMTNYGPRRRLGAAEPMVTWTTRRVSSARSEARA